MEDTSTLIFYTTPNQLNGNMGSICNQSRNPLRIVQPSQKDIKRRENTRLGMVN